MNSVTAQLTAYVWYRHGLSHPRLTSLLGRLAYLSLAPAQAAYRRQGRGPGFEEVFLWRHRLIDQLLSDCIERRSVTQALEIAAGFSGRGWRCKKRYGDRLRYVETDLPGLAARKLRALRRGGLLVPGHDVVALDALRENGELGLAAVAAKHLDPARGTVIITEGLLNYLPYGEVRGLWRRIAAVLRTFPNGTYISDLYIGDEGLQWLASRAFRWAITAMTMNRTYVHFQTPVAVSGDLTACGFDLAQVHDPARTLEPSGTPPPGGSLIRVFEAAVRSRS